VTSRMATVGLVMTGSMLDSVVAWAGSDYSKDPVWQDLARVMILREALFLPASGHMSQIPYRGP
jgi:hypothetical protein